MRQRRSPFRSRRASASQSGSWRYRTPTLRRPAWRPGGAEGVELLLYGGEIDVDRPAQARADVRELLFRDGERLAVRLGRGGGRQEAGHRVGDAVREGRRGGLAALAADGIAADGV